MALSYIKVSLYIISPLKGSISHLRKELLPPVILSQKNIPSVTRVSPSVTISQRVPKVSQRFKG